MEKKRFSVLSILKTALVIGLALYLPGCVADTETPPPEEPEPPVAEEAPIWTKERVLDLFNLSDAAEGAIVLDCALCPDMAYDMVGAVMYTGIQGDSCGIAFVREDGFVARTGLQAAPAPDAELVYLGDGTVLFSLGQENGPVRHLLSYSSDGPDAYWEVVSEDVAPEEFEGLA